MCGISGGWLPEGISPGALTESLGAMAHRGPDDRGTCSNGPVFLGMRRLAIIDLEGGKQPLFNEDGSIAVVFNGEIYNYRELTPDLEARGHTFSTVSDTELLVHLYEERGTTMCDNLRGMFAFAIWDAGQRCLFVARDRFGKKPLYYMRTRSGGLLFASELKALRPLADAAGESWVIREQGIYDYLSLGIVPQPDTIYRDVFALPPGSWMRFDGENLAVETYWQLDFTPKREVAYPEAVARVRDLVSEAVTLRLRSDVPLGVFLSSGVDSSVVTFEAARQVGETLQTFTVATDDVAYDESAVARQTANLLQVENTILHLEVSPLEDLQYLVRQYDQPFSDPSAIPSLAISRLARQHVTVVLNGDGGDEVFSGYRRYLAALRSDQFRRVPRSVAASVSRMLEHLSGERRTALGFAARFARGLALDPVERFVTWNTDMLLETDKRLWWAGPAVRPTEEWVASVLSGTLSALDTFVQGNVRINLLSDLLVKMDIATMAFSLEGRSPLLDHKLGEYVVRLPDSYRLRGGRLKALLRDAYKGRLPEEVLNGPKRGFEIPLRAWLEKELKPLLMDTLATPTARVCAFLDSSFVSELVAGRLLQERNWARTVYALLVLELWLREFA